MLAILYWVILVLALIGVLSPPTWKFAPRLNGLAVILLFVIIGLKVLRVPL
jgi:hypothetical protein